MSDQWRSYLSLKTSVLVVFLIFWNGGFLIAMFVVGNGFNSPITPQAGVAISFVCLVASIFGFLVAKSKKMRDKLLEPKRSHNYREQDFYLLGFVGLALAIGMYYIPSFGHAQSF